MFVRIKTTPNSPRRSVQVVESRRVGQKISQVIVRHMGIALDEAEEVKLRAMAEEFIQKTLADQLNENSLLEVEPSQIQRPRRGPGRPPRQTLEDIAPPQDVSLGDVCEVARHIEGPHEILGHLYDYLGFNSVLACKSEQSRAATMLRDLVIARAMAKGDSKRECARQLDIDYGKTYSTDSLYRLMDAVHERLDALKTLVFQATAGLCAGQVDMMLFDVTTLYFESVEKDELREFGYSKDQKYHCTQVVLAMATDADGLPIGYEIFAGNTAEVRTLIECMHQWSKTLHIGQVNFCADRALCSRANLALLEEHQLNYVVAMPMRKSLNAAGKAQVLQTKIAQPCLVENELLWVREMDWEGRRLIVSYSSKRAHKDRADRQAIIDKLNTKLAKASGPVALDPITGEVTTPRQVKAKQLISNAGYLKYIQPADEGGSFVLHEDNIQQDAQWDGLHAIVTNDHKTPAQELLARYRRLWMIEDSFRVIKHDLGIRPIYHFKPERIKAHIGICFLAFALMRHAQQRIKLAQRAMSVEHIRTTLHSVQASILEHKKTKAKYRLPSAFSQDAARIYKAFGIQRKLDVDTLTN